MTSRQSESAYLADLHRMLRLAQGSEDGGGNRAEVFNNLLITGGRGSGKSTLLRAFADSLDPTKYIVLPKIDPELMFSGDSLMSWALTGLEQTFAEEALDETPTDADVTIRKRIHDLRRNYVLVASDVSSSLVNRGVAPAEFARDASSLTPVGMQLSSSWERLLADVASLDTFVDASTVLLVDDVDLHPSMLSSILRQLELMSTSRRFIAVLAAEIHALSTSMVLGDASEAEYWQRALDTNFATPQQLLQLADRKLAKYFPRQLRVELSDEPVNTRLGFIPAEGGADSLGAILESFPLDYRGLASLRDLFEVRDSSGARITANGYCDAFPGNRRALQQLHSALDALRTNHADPAAGLALILEHGFADCASALPLELRSALKVEVEPSHSSMSLNASKLDFGRTLGRGYLLFNPARSGSQDGPRIPVFLRRMDYFYTTVAKPGTDDTTLDPDGGSFQAPQVLPAIFSALMFLAWEAKEVQHKDKALIDINSFAGLFMTPGLRNWVGTVATAKEEGLPYLMVPDWEEYSDYYSYTYGWNKLVEDINAATRNTSFNKLFCLEYAILQHIRLICSIQVRKALPDLVYSPPLVADGDGETWDEFGVLLAMAAKELSEAIEAERPNIEKGQQRAQDFASWIDLGFPLCSSRNLSSARLSDGLREIYTALGHTDPERRSLRNYLASELPNYLNADRAEADIDLLRFVDPTRANILQNVRTALSERVIAQKRNTLQQLRDAQIDEIVMHALETEGADMQVLAALNAAGVNGQSLSLIAELFPTSRTEDASTGKSG